MLTELLKSAIEKRKNQISEDKLNLLYILISQIEDIDIEIQNLTQRIENNKDYKYSIHRGKIEYIREKTKLVETIYKILSDIDKQLLTENNNIVENLSDIFESILNKK